MRSVDADRRVADLDLAPTKTSLRPGAWVAYATRRPGRGNLRRTDPLLELLGRRLHSQLYLYARISRTTCPWTSVRRKSRPA
jgi:hypothetical protein